jgi:hypothetical protein
MATESIGFSGIATRFVAALLLVVLTYNPSGWSYVHWAAREWASLSPPVVLAGIALLIGWGIYVGATARSLGMLGTLLFGALFAALVWSHLRRQMSGQAAVDEIERH